MRYRRHLTHSKLRAAFFLGVATLSAGAQIDAPANPPPVSISLLPPQRMTAGHAATASAMQESVARSAQIYGYTLDSSYDYREIACPYAPQDVLLAYESTSWNGAISRFTAILSPSGMHGQNPVQIIPILNFGVTPFVPAYSNSHSVEIFNQAVDTAPVGSAALAEIQAGRAPIVLRGLCFLAMVGAEPSALRSPSLEAATFQAPVPTLQFLDNRKTRQLISIRSSASTYQIWTLTFSSGGKLMTASREERPVERTPVLLEAGAPVAAPNLIAPVAADHAPVPPAMQPVAVSTPKPETASPVAPAEATPATEGVAALPATATVPVATPEPATPAAAIAESSMAQPAVAPRDAAVTPPAPVASVSPAPVSPAPTEHSLPTAPATATMVAPAAPSTPAVPAATFYPDRQTTLPEPPHRFIADPPPPPHRFIPASALQTPPHLPQ